MVRERFAVRLTPEERGLLEQLVRPGRSPARVATRARILLETGEGWSAPKVAQAFGVAESSLYRFKRRFAEGGLDGVLQNRRIARKLEFHHTAKHSSWLNMAEIEFSVLSRNCL